MTFRINFTFALAFVLLANSSVGQNRREAGNLVLEDIPEIPDSIRIKLQQYQNTRSASFEDWLPDGNGILISTRFGNTTQLHTVNSPGAARTQITFFDEPVTNGVFSLSKDYEGFLYRKDIGGNEFYQIFWYNLATGNSEMLSDGKSRNLSIEWSCNGDKFAFTSTRRNNKDNDIYVSEMSDPKKADLIVDKGNGTWFAMNWNEDDSKLLVVQRISINKSNSYYYDFEKNDLMLLNDSTKEAVFMSYSWNAKGDKIYIISDNEREFRTLGLYDWEKAKVEYLTKDIPWDIESFTMNKARTKAAFVVNENGYSQLYLLDTKTNNYQKIPDLPIGQISSVKFHPEKEMLAMTLNTPKTPGDVFTLDLETMEVIRWTYSEVGGLNTNKFPEPELISYETFDEAYGKKRMIPAFVYKPQIPSKKPLPVLIQIHGGPESQHTPLFRSFNAFLANELGIAVIGPNVRGSEGYGKTYLKLDNGFLRENSVKDIGALLEWIGKQPEFDSERIAVYGGSYGGFMVLASMYLYGDKIKCGVDVVGVSNFVTFLENTQDYRRDQRRVEYGDERDPEMREYLNKIAPTNNVDKINKPLFVVQGANDPRVPQSESEQMVRSIRENNGKVWYMLAKDEGHGFRKKENQDYMTEAIALFLQEFLLRD